MYLKSIEIHGFKSFADKIKLEFLNGITGIVGPNGSGKSNVADAVRWVLGEQSAKQLRGASMQDVIFSGTEIRKPMGYAYVSICMDNSDRALGADYDEVTVTRRVYRSGESEYLINDNECRLKDISELFYDTGIGQEGYSIIGQGQIDKILSGRPEERRELFDEAAGIVKFKRRKETALKKLETEKNNLVRVQDILSEVEKQIGPLEKQSEAAKIYLKKREELKSYEVNSFLLEAEKCGSQLKEIEEKAQTAGHDLEAVTAEYEASRVRYDEAGLRIEELDNTIDSMRAQISDTAVQRGRIEAQIQVLREQIRSINNTDQHYNERIDFIKAGLEHNETDLQKLNEKKAQIDAQIAEEASAGTDSEAELQKYDSRIAELSASVETNKKLIVDTLASRGAVKGSLERLKTMQEQADIRKAELNSRLLRSKSDEASQEETITGLNDELKDTSEEIRKCDEAIAGNELEAGRARDAIDEADTKEREIDALYHEKKTRLESLKNIAERYEGYGNAVRRVMEQKGANHGICGVVADIIKVDGKYETAIETALGANLQNVVVKDEATAKKMIELLKTERAGRVTFLPLTSIQKRDFKAADALKGEGVIGMADTLVHVDREYTLVAQNLLGNFIVVDNMDNALALARKFGFTLRIVTVAGEALNPGGSIAGGSFRNSGNLLGRQREIEELSAELKKALKDKDEILQKIEELRDRKNEIKNAGAVLKENMQKAQLKLNTVQMNLKAAREKKDDTLNGSIGLRSEHADIDRQLEDIMKQQKDIMASLSDSERIEKEADEAVTVMNAELEKINGESAELRRKVNDFKLRNAQFIQQQEFTQQNLDRIQGEITQLNNELSHLTDSIEKDAAETEQKNKDIKELELTLDASGNVKSEKQKELDLKIAEKEAAAVEQKKLFDERDSINARKSALEREQDRLVSQKEKLEASAESLTRYMWDEYQLTMNSCRELENKELGSLADMKKNTLRLKGEIRELGDVNVNAIEEYRTLMERYTLMSGQRDDLIKAGDDLSRIIEDLDTAMRKQFTEQFAMISAQFDIVFKEMFGGGKGTLELVEDEDILEAGIKIIAQPPGKKLQNMMQLSGGEKALTAIALLFAIQNLKPSPFCLLDEIEAALDEANVDRFASYLAKLTDHTQFIVITHRRGTMVKADRLYGITMQEKGVSTQVAVDLTDEQFSKDIK